MDPTPVGGAPLLVTADVDLTDELLRLAAAAGVTPQVLTDPERARGHWWRAACVVVGADSAEQVAALGLGRRADVWLVARVAASTASASPNADGVPAELWRLGVVIHADHVVTLPDGQDWLVRHLSDAVDAPSERAVTMGLIGARGGAGASTLAAALALQAARDAKAVLLVDADPLGGGIELVMGCESSTGLRWPEVAATQGRVGAGALREALPVVDGVSVLSWDRGDARSVEPDTMRAMVDAGRRGFDLVVLDLPRRLDDAAVEACASADILLLVCTADVRAAAGAGRQLGLLRTLCGDLRLVVRRSAGTGVAVDDLAATLRLPLLGQVSTQRGLERSVNEGLGPLVRGRFGSQCRRLLDTVAQPVAGAA